MTMKLIKQTSTEWHGNGFGSVSAQWLVEGTSIRVAQLGSFWYAIQGDQKIARGATKSDLLENMALKGIWYELPEL